MNSVAALLFALLAGVVLGSVFFGGLWWTAQKGLASTVPAAWFFGSLLLRTAITLGGLYLIGVGNWQRLVACVVGFLIARLVTILLIRAPAATGVRP